MTKAIPETDGSKSSGLRDDVTTIEPEVGRGRQQVLIVRIDGFESLAGCCC
jgi:hypothetical protein